MKYPKIVNSEDYDEININMRCIEIFDESFVVIVVKGININMRCIEIANSNVTLSAQDQININMRCIEIL